MNFTSEMDERERQRAKNQLYGRQPAMECMVAISAVILVFLALFFLVTMTLLGGMGQKDYYVVFVMEALVLVMAGIMAAILVSHEKMVRELKVKYEALSTAQQEKMFEAASMYQKENGIEWEEDYIYGIMVPIHVHSLLKRGMLSFQYLEYRNLLWIYEVHNTTMVGNLETGTTRTFRNTNEDRIRIYEVNGNQYEAATKNTNCTELMNMIREKNPKCRIGYSAENKAWYQSHVL